MLRSMEGRQQEAAMRGTLPQSTDTPMPSGCRLPNGSSKGSFGRSIPETTQQAHSKLQLSPVSRDFESWVIPPPPSRHVAAQTAGTPYSSSVPLTVPSCRYFRSRPGSSWPMLLFLNLIVSDYDAFTNQDRARNCILRAIRRQIRLGGGASIG